MWWGMKWVDIDTLSYRLTVREIVTIDNDICNCSKVLFSDRPSASRVATSTEVKVQWSKVTFLSLLCFRWTAKSFRIGPVSAKWKVRDSGVNERVFKHSHYPHTYVPTQLVPTFTSDGHTQCKYISNTHTHTHTHTHKHAPMHTNVCNYTHNLSLPSLCLSPHTTHKHSYIH